jgi:hypothetical protein
VLRRCVVVAEYEKVVAETNRLAAPLLRTLFPFLARVFLLNDLFPLFSRVFSFKDDLLDCKLDYGPSSDRRKRVLLGEHTHVDEKELLLIIFVIFMYLSSRLIRRTKIIIEDQK